MLFKPYRVGDFIEAQGQSGTVKEIQLFNTATQYGRQQDHSRSEREPVDRHYQQLFAGSAPPGRLDIRHRLRGRLRFCEGDARGVARCG
ncbi:MAG: mechanosensitive ion channel domain-containing protein [Alistipes indistinctus]